MSGSAEVAPAGRRGRILFFITSLFRDGAETQLVRLAIAMTKRGWSVSIVTIMDHNDFAASLADAGIGVESLKVPRGRYDPSSLPRLVRIIRSHQPDIVCTFMYHANVLGRVASKIARVPSVVSSIRNSVFGGAIADRLMAATDRLADFTTTNSRLAAEALLERRVVARERLLVIPNAVDLKSDSEQSMTRSSALWDGIDSRWLWLSVGRLEEQKGHDVTIRAMAELKGRGVDSHLIIAGSGGLESELVRLRDELGLQEDVTFLGYRTDISRLMTVSDGFILASRWEGLPNVVMEACAVGLPVLAADVGGVTEIIEDGVSGVVVRPDDSQTLSLAMGRLMSLERSRLDQMTALARKSVEQKFEANAVMAQWDALFSSLKSPVDER